MQRFVFELAAAFRPNPETYTDLVVAELALAIEGRSASIEAAFGR
jgi:hypothetical protein